MRQMLLGIFAAALVFSAGCAPAKPMTEADFKGFCYQTGQGKELDCDAIAVCDPYTVVLNTAQPSLQKCLDECSDIYARQAMRYSSNGCAGPAECGPGLVPEILPYGLPKIAGVFCRPIRRTERNGLPMEVCIWNGLKRSKAFSPRRRRI